MKFSEYLNDNVAGICITVFTYLLMLFMMYSFKFNADMIIILSVVYFTGFLSRVLWDYFRKKKFYENLVNSSEQLDKKYLISEVIEEPDFLEGKIIHEVLYKSGRAMAENIDVYRKNAEDFREYIELWVHEIKLPVASLILSSHNDENSEKYGQQLRKIDTCIENVLYYSRSESAEKDYIIKPVELQSVFRNIAVKNRNELLSINASINTSGLDKTVVTDGKWLEFILGQFLSNSIKYTSAEPELNIYAEEDKDSVIFHFRDNGTGIPKTDLPYIFDKSYTGENGRTHSRSTGMGLYIAKNLCNRLGHKIYAESVQGEYTDMIIVFGKNDYVKPV